jgi:HD-like signal output (HDOD) protein
MPTPVSDQELAAAVAELPPVSSVLQRILAVLDDPNSDLDDISRLVRAETALSAQVLRLVNTAHFGLPKAVSSIPEALQILGITEINRLVSALGSRQLFLRPLTHYGFAAEMLWHHTLAVAVSAETIAANTRADRSASYLAGILHPVGLVALDHVAAARDIAPRPQDAPLLAWEREKFDCDNAALAARVLRLWKFPEPLAAAVAARYGDANVAAEASAEVGQGAGVLRLASSLAEKLGAGLPPERGLFRATPETIAAAGLPWDEFSELQLEAAQNLERTRALLKLA